MYNLKAHRYTFKIFNVVYISSKNINITGKVLIPLETRIIKLSNISQIYVSYIGFTFTNIKVYPPLSNP